MTEVYLSLGSNLDDKKENLQAAVNLMREDKKIEIERISSIYLTEPVGYKYQDDFYNIVLKLKFEGTPKELLEICKDIEKRMKREDSFKWGPRTIDLDIITFGNNIMKTDDLTIPHVEFKNRKFVLIPLKEIAPDFVCPGGNKGIEDLINTCKDNSKINRIKSELV